MRTPSFDPSRSRAVPIAFGPTAEPCPLSVSSIDYKNQLHDGDFAPDPHCFPSLKALSQGIRASINATTMFSLWPEALVRALFLHQASGNLKAEPY